MLKCLTSDGSGRGCVGRGGGRSQQVETLEDRRERNVERHFRRLFDQRIFWKDFSLNKSVGLKKQNKKTF